MGLKVTRGFRPLSRSVDLILGARSLLQRMHYYKNCVCPSVCMDPDVLLQYPYKAQSGDLSPGL